MATFGPPAQPIILPQLFTAGYLRAREPKPYLPSFLFSPTYAKYTEFYCQFNGSNLNAGSTTDAAAVYTTTNGNWNGSTTFTPTDGSTPADSIKPGDWVSIYLDASTVTGFITRISAVADGVNGAITVLGTTFFAGTPPSSGATGRTLKCGGAFRGPQGSQVVPFNLQFANAKNANNDPPRINVKNDAVYNITSQLNTGGNSCVKQGYSDVPGDGGKAIFDGGSNAIILMVGTEQGSIYADFVFQNNGSSGANQLVNLNTAFVRCVFANSRGTGATCSSTSSFYECEFYNCNLARSVNGCALSLSTPATVVYKCYFHDLVGTTTHGIIDGGTGGLNIILIESIFDTIGGNALVMNESSSTTGRLVIGNSFYNIGGAAIKDNAVGPNLIRNIYCYNNLVVNCGGVIDPGFNTPIGFNFNTGFNNIKGGPRLLPNVKGLQDIGAFAISRDPYNAPDTGDFSLVSAEAIGTGRGVFLQQASSKFGTIGYPDLGAAQAQSTTQNWAGTNTQTLPYGYVNYSYAWKWNFLQDTTITVQSGSLPPGLSLSQPRPNVAYITGIPTTVGVYDFTLRATVGTSTGDSPFEITIAEDPDEGTGGMLGG